MEEVGLLFALYVATTGVFYTLWQLLNKPLWIEKVRDYGNLLACFLPFPMYWAISVDYIPHSITYLTYMLKYFRISEICRTVETVYHFLPLVFFIFAFPKCRKNWKISLIISLIAIPAIDLDAFLCWLHGLPDSFSHPNSNLDEAKHLTIFSKNLSWSLAIFTVLVLLILMFDKPVRNRN